MFTVAESKNFLKITFLDRKNSNALNLTSARELSRLVKAYKKWTQPVVVKSGHPRLFCSGGDLTEYKKLKSKSEGLKINREITRELNNFGEWAVNKLAVINGDVLGGGMEWLARFNHRWILPHVFLSFWQRRIGLTPGWGGGEWWSAKIGEDRLLRLLLEARLQSAEESLRLGLVDRIVSKPYLGAEVDAWASRMNFAISSELLNWKSSKAEKTFSKLWLASEHSRFLRGWK